MRIHCGRERGAGDRRAGAIGYAVGAVLRFWLVAPLVAIAVYLGATVAGGLQFRELYWASQLYPSTIRESSPFDVTITATFIGQSVWYLGLIALALAAVIALVGSRLASSWLPRPWSPGRRRTDGARYAWAGGAFRPGFGGTDRVCGEVRTADLRARGIRGEPA